MDDDGLKVLCALPTLFRFFKVWHIFLYHSVALVFVNTMVYFFCCCFLLLNFELFVRGIDCANFKTLFLRTDVRVRSEIVWGCRIRAVMIFAI